MKKQVEKLPDKNQRVKDLIDYFANGNVSGFLVNLEGISHQSLNRIFNIDRRKGGYPGVSSDIFTAITKGYPQVDPQWLLVGEGTMLRKGHKEKVGNDQGKGDDPSPMQILDRLSQAFRDQAKALADQAEGFKAQAEAFKGNTELLVAIKNIMDRQDRRSEVIESNLIRTLETVRTVAGRQEADEEIILQSLARLEKLPSEKKLLQDAGKRRDQIEKAARKFDTKAEPSK